MDISSAEPNDEIENFVDDVQACMMCFLWRVTEAYDFGIEKL